MTTFISGLFDKRASAQNAVDELEGLGVPRVEISLLVNEQARGTYFDEAAATDETGDKSAEGAGAGAVIGGTLGALGALLTLTAGNLFLPGVGLLASGPLLAALAGAGAGGAVGTLIGTLVGAGIPEEQATLYQTGLRSGNLFVSAHVPSALTDEALGIFSTQGAHDVYTRYDDASAPR